MSDGIFGVPLSVQPWPFHPDATIDTAVSPMNPLKTFLIDGKQDVVQCFVLPEMSLSSARAKMVQHAFILSMKAEPIVEFVEPFYAAWIADSRRDDEICGSPQDELARAGYPSLMEVLRTPGLTELVFGHYLLGDWLRPFTWDGIAPIEYWMDAVTSCKVVDDHLELHGVCFSKSSDK